MKPNKKQQKVCDIIVDQAKFWSSTNDINSPTHYCDLEETLRNTVTFDELTQEEADYIEKTLTDLYVYIKKLK